MTAPPIEVGRRLPVSCSETLDGHRIVEKRTVDHFCACCRTINAGCGERRINDRDIKNVGAGASSAAQQSQGEERDARTIAKGVVLTVGYRFRE